MINQKNNILHIDSSGRYQHSLTRQLSALVTKHIAQKNTDSQITSRDVAKGLPFINEQWIAANFTPQAERTEENKAALALSDELVKELQQASHIVIGVPIYNFNIPAVLKAWIDLIARAQLTFQYTEQGPKGLLTDKKAYLVFASGGVPIGSDMDFASKYLSHILAFIGITDVTIIDSASIDLNNHSTDGQAILTDQLSTIIPL